MFIEILPYKKKSMGNVKDVIRISFTKLKEKFILRIFIGYNVANQFNITEQDKVSLFYEKENPKTFLIKKSQASIGYSLFKTKDSFRTQLMWNADILNPSSMTNIREVEFNKFEDGIRFYVK